MHFAKFVLLNLHKTRNIDQNINFYAKHVIANWPKFTVSAHRIKQPKVYSKIYLKINHVYATHNWLLLVKKN